MTESELDRIIRTWATAYNEEVLQYAQPPAVEDSEVFADVYHNLIHSPLSMTLLQLEANYASVVEAVARERDVKMAEMEARHSREMAETVTAATTNKTPRPIIITGYIERLGTRRSHTPSTRANKGMLGEQKVAHDLI